MQYVKLFPVVLIIGLIGCTGVEVEKSNVAKVDTANREALKTEPQPAFEFNNATFDAPLMLLAAGEPMKAGHSYPSPAVFDVDNDGDLEMVLGEIMGSVWYCENENKSAGDPVWSALSPVQTAAGKPLKLNNW